MSAVARWRDARKAQKEGRPGIERRQRARLADAVRHARAHSPWYQRFYAGLPERVTDPAVLPVTDKRQLMAHFDDWVTDPAVTLAGARAFADDPSLVGARFLDRYLLTTTSGTTGAVGIFLADDHTLAVAGALVARGILGRNLFTPATVARILARGGRSVKIGGTGGHFAMAAAEAAQQRRSPRRRRTVRLLSVQTPLPELVARIDAFRPAIIECYASTGLLLAAEREAGRLHADPVVVSLSGEGLSAPEYERVRRAFPAARIHNLYGCNEAVALSFSCPENWLHIHEDWVLFEPVDEHHRPTPPGQPSHTVLLSTLYRREQPILRYDLGDSVLRRPDPCPCGSPFMAVRVQGRAAAVLRFATAGGAAGALVPLAVETAVERTTGIALYQVAQTAPDTLRVRLRTTDDADPPRVRGAVRAELDRLLADHGLAGVTVEVTDQPPVQTAGGKYPHVIPYAGEPDGSARPSPATSQDGT